MDSHQAFVVAQIKLPHQALFDPAAGDGTCQLVIVKRDNLQPTVLVRSRDSHASCSGIQIQSRKNDESCSSAGHEQWWCACPPIVAHSRTRGTSAVQIVR